MTLTKRQRVKVPQTDTSSMGTSVSFSMPIIPDVVDDDATQRIDRKVFKTLSPESSLSDTPRPIEWDGLLGIRSTLAVFPKEPHER